MSAPNAFAMPSSAVNPFLYAEIGGEGAGANLTVLSLLARLGEDPWALALEWSRLPRGRVIALLAERIGRAPLNLADPTQVATRLSKLLPAPQSEVAPGGAAPPMPGWLPPALLACALLVALLATLFATPAPPRAVPPVPVHGLEIPPR